jgi:hypothetical protein
MIEDLPDSFSPTISIFFMFVIVGFVALIGIMN